ncbi:MAG: carboxypeptidase regulatory-like domain-containing protein [Bryobacterales bacterium]|nr:carboxypeptidase regulatory-like domain-containing protein [Bryobacterales bacterium]
MGVPFRARAAAILMSAAVFGSLLVPQAMAQSGAGAIQGTVQDLTEAAIPGCKVHVVNTQTNVANDSVSNEVGFFAVRGLFAGTYTLTFSSPGMRDYQTTITLQNAQVVVLNPRLTVGEVSEKVTVSAETVQLATYDSGTVSTHLDSSRIDQLPQNGRNVLGLAQRTVPGLEANGTRANGLMGEALEYSQDGAPITNRNFGSVGNTSQSSLPDPDAVKEAKFETMNSSAQFSTPGTVILTTKSGTNQVHGSFFETARNNYFGIARARQNPADFAAPHLVRNEFGASIGGPIVLPKIYNGKNRTFFFFAYERFSLRQDANQLVRVPTPEMRVGDFSGLISGQGLLQQLYDPSTTQSAANQYSRLPFSGNRIPISRISPLARTLYAATPAPNRPDNPLVNANLVDVNKITQTVPNITTRLDHVFNETNRVYLRYTDIRQTQQALRNYPSASPANIEGGGLPAGATGYQTIPVNTVSHAIGWTRTISPTFFSETILSQQWQSMYVEGNPASQANYEAQLGLPNNFGQTGFPAIGTNLIMPYGGSQWNYGMNQRVDNVDQNMNKIWGKHQFAFGGRYRHERFGYLSDRSPDMVDFSRLATAVYDPATGANFGIRPNTGYQDADFFLGAASNFTQRLNAPFGRSRLQSFAGYIQDNYRVSRRLTLNLGMRWEGLPAPHSDGGNYATFSRKDNAIILKHPMEHYYKIGYTTEAIVTNLRNLGAKFMTPKEAGLPEAGFFGYWNNFLPRVGFAWVPGFGKGGTVIRGGYGRYLYPVPIRNSVRYLTSVYPFVAAYSQNFNSAQQSPDGLPNYLLRAPQTIIAGQNSRNVVNTSTVNSLLPGIAMSTTLDAEYPPATVDTVNMTVEQPFRDGSVFRVTYLYTHGSNLDQNFQYNNAPSAYVWQTTTGTIPPTGALASVATRPYDNRTWGGNVVSTKYGWSNNSALQVNYQRPFKKGYGYQVFYVYSRAFRVGGNTFRDNVLYPAANWAPGVLPANLNVGDPLKPSREFNRYQNYAIDSAIPVHRVNFNGIVDVPVGKGKRFLGNANRFVNAALGGFQLAYTGQVVSQMFLVGSGNWGETNPIQTYKEKVPITDCRSGVCREGFLWFNGYIAPNLVNAPRGVQGLPADYKPYLAPINNTPGTPQFGNNNVSVALRNGTSVITAFNPGPAGVHPFNRTFLMGPYNWQTDMSLFKVFQLTERFKLRFNLDAFNAFNMQGLTNPGTGDGIQLRQTSYWTPRQIQFTLRLSY